MKRITIILLVLLIFVSEAAPAADTWADRLGYRAGTRVLILYADHGGAAYEFNRPAQELLSTRLVQSASVMMPCSWSHQFARWSRDNSDHDVGVCVTLSSPNKILRFRPVCGSSDVPSLVDADGYLCRSLLQVAMRADIDEVGREVRRQIELARAAGIRPTHLIPHEGMLLTRPDLLELYLRVAQDYWVPAVMIEMTPSQIERLRDEGFPLSQEMIDIIGRYPLPKLDDLRSVPDADSYEAKRDEFCRLVQGLAPGITQIILQPADETEALKLVSPRWQNQVWEAHLLRDPQVSRFLKKEGVQLTDWIEIMQRFEEADPSGS